MKILALIGLVVFVIVVAYINATQPRSQAMCDHEQEVLSDKK